MGRQKKNVVRMKIRGATSIYAVVNHYYHHRRHRHHHEMSPLPLCPLLAAVVARAAGRTEMPLSEREVLAQVESFLSPWAALDLSIVNHAICNLRRVTVFAYRIVSLHNGDTAKTLEGTLDLTNYHIWFARPFPDPPPTDAYLSSFDVDHGIGL